MWPTVTDPFPNLNDRWNWYQGVSTGASAMLLDPNDLFGHGFTDWTPFSALGLNWDGLAYTVEGTTGAMTCGADWLSVDPDSGTTAPDGSTEVTVAFDSAGLATGDYTAELCVESNDPVAPVVTVPVTLTVSEEPGEPALVQRIEGAERYATAAQISARARWPAARTRRWS